MASPPKSISGPLGAKFGRDPTEFFINLVKAQKKLFRRLTARLAARTNVGSWETTNAQGKKYKARMIAREDDSLQKVATIVALWAIKDPKTTADEAGRMAYNRPVGPSTKSLDEMNPDNDDVTIIGTEEWPVPWGMGAEKGEPITAAVALTAGVAILCAIAPFVLPKLMAFAEEKASELGITRPKSSGPAPKKVEAKIFGIPATFVAVGGAGLLAYAALRK